MAIAMTEEMGASLHRGLSEWWSEETEYIFQRIERWAALARGYNRLRSQRLSRGRLTMQEEQEPRWSISSNKIVIEDPDWSPRFHNLRRSHRRKSRTDENCRINCCGTFNYQSSCNLDSNCLENYRYDHSIYFKTIGDIKSSKRDGASVSDEENEGASGDERVEWEAKSPIQLFDEFCNNDEPVEDPVYKVPDDDAGVRIRVNGFSFDERSSFDEPRDRAKQSVWPIVDLSKLSLDVDSQNDNSTDEPTRIDNCDDLNSRNSDYDNNNSDESNLDTTEKMIQLQLSQLTTNQTRLDSSLQTLDNSITSPKNHSTLPRITSMRRSRRSSRKVRQPAVVGDNNVLWPSVLLNYTKNADNSAVSPHHYRAFQVK
ncbi:uncharacterized protein [Venturia canescens]|uniref:uncharacterized protein n=1 Tax=Venturia canescens TaxID=32260 RepID=UPI001C9D48AC|nr:uncharacterized protein LOC122410825 [Venturia canescens]